MRSNGSLGFTKFHAGIQQPHTKVAPDLENRRRRGKALFGLVDRINHLSQATRLATIEVQF